MQRQAEAPVQEPLSFENVTRRYGGLTALAGIDLSLRRDEITAVRQAYKWLNRSGLTLPDAIARITEAFPGVPATDELVLFIRGTKRGICTGHQVTYDPTHQVTHDPNHDEA